MKIISLSAIAHEPVSHNPAIQKRMMLRPQEIDNLVYFSRAYIAPGEIAGAHSHPDMSEIFFVESGSGTICVDDTAYPLNSGTCIAVEPGERHEVSNTGNEELVLTYFAVMANASSERTTGREALPPTLK
jgi:mannose-6-phosphate isomerase-like protein (cupin superfamily)